MTPKELLECGRAILDPLLAAYGFQFYQTQAGRGSGGHFAVGTYRSGEWVLEPHVRGMLGIVNYQVGDAVLEHHS